MPSAKPLTQNRSLWLGVASLLLAAACGTSATSDPVRTYRIRRLADSPVARTAHITVALPDGNALVMGGNSSDTINVPDSTTTQRFDARTETFTAGPDLALSAADRQFTVAVPLRGGAFLLVGAGINGAVGLSTPSTALTQRFDPVHGGFVRSGDLQRVRSVDAAATLLADGRVLVTGGGLPPFAFSEIYDPGTEQWQIGENLQVARRGHTATLLADGRVLLAGGIVCCTANGEIFTGAAEVYDPATGKFQVTGSLLQARGFHRATLLSDGRVLLSGGFGLVSATEIGALASSEIFDPATQQFSTAGSLRTARAEHNSILLRDGQVLAVGGTSDEAGRGISQTELFDASTGKWTPGPLLQPARVRVTATLLASGKVLLFGGADDQGFPRPEAFLLE